MSAVVKILVPISGGKDSQASLKLALKSHAAENIRGLFCDTQFEHPINYAHVEHLKGLYGVRIDTVTGGSVEDKVRKYKRFPGGGARHCTDELKIRETRIYCKALAKEQGGFEVWYGMRSDESSQRATRYAGKVSSGIYLPHEVLRKYPQYLGKLGVRFRLPIIDWSTKDVITFLAGEENPLYAAGFDRVGCFPCLAGGDKWKEKAFAHDDFGRDQYRKVIKISQDIGKSPWTSKGAEIRNAGSGCAVCSI